MKRIFLLLIWAVLGVRLVATATESTLKQTHNQRDSLHSEPIPVVEEVVMVSPEPTRRPLFGLKTNLLYDAMTALHIEVAVPYGCVTVKKVARDEKTI